MAQVWGRRRPEAPLPPGAVRLVPRPSSL
jgi:hypothetical protein